MKLILRCITLVIGLFCTLSWAETQSARLSLLTSNMPYFSEVDPADPERKPRGYSVMLASAIVAELSLELEVRSVPWARLIREVHNDSHIIATGVVRTPEREEQFYWITPITYNPVGLYGKSRAIGADPWQSIKSIAVLRGDYRENIAKQNQIPQILSTNSWLQAVKAVVKGRVDAVFFSGIGMQHICDVEGLICEKLSLLHMERTAVSHIAMSKKPENQLMAEKLMKAALKVKQSPEFSIQAHQWLQASALLKNHSTYVNGAIVFDGASTAPARIELSK